MLIEKERNVSRNWKIFIMGGDRPVAPVKLLSPTDCHFYSLTEGDILSNVESYLMNF